MTTKKTLVIGHRGASGYTPENTLKSFEQAARQNADGIELDVFLTSDGEVVVTHDENCKRLAGVDMWVRKSTLAKLKELDFGQKEKIPTLREVLSEFGSIFNVINIEIKSTGIFSDGIEQAVTDLVSHFKLDKKVLISSFNPLNLYRVKKCAPQIRRGLLVDPDSKITQLLGLWIPLTEPDTLNIENKWSKSSKNMYILEKLQKKLWVWTVNSKEDMTFWSDKGADAIITNYPDVGRELIDQK